MLEKRGIGTQFSAEGILKGLQLWLVQMDKMDILLGQPVPSLHLMVKQIHLAPCLLHT